jgi:hypothetical protein
MPRKKSRRKEVQAKRRAEEAAKVPKPNPARRVGIIAHHQRGAAALALLAAGAARLDRSN